MNLPEGFILRADKALYGLRHSPAAWKRHFTEVMAELDFKPSLSDSSLFISSDGAVRVPVHVDDLVPGGPKSRVVELLEQLKSRLTIDKPK
jgi:hypothetical protein